MVEPTLEKVEMMGWMSAGRAGKFVLLRERMPWKMAPLGAVSRRPCEENGPETLRPQCRPGRERLLCGP